jgi:ribosome-associated protein
LSGAERHGVRISAHTTIPWDELAFTFDRSSGPGGQNVNKVATRATLVFDLRASRVLTEEQRARLLMRLASRLDGAGRLRLVCQVHRTQSANRAEVVRRLAELLRSGLRPLKVRRTTQATAASRMRRRERKSRRSESKQSRSWRASGDD